MHYFYLGFIFLYGLGLKGIHPVIEIPLGEVPFRWIDPIYVSALTYCKVC